MHSHKSAFLLSAFFAGSHAAGIIQVQRERMTNLSGEGDVWNLFDEQVLAGDPKAYAADHSLSKPGAPSTEYTNGWVNAALHYPLEAVVDLGAEHTISDAWYYDINGADSVRVSCGDGKRWKTMLDRSTTAYMSWVGGADSCTGRYVKVRIKSPSTAITELLLYGAAHGTPAPLPDPVVHAKPTIGQLMGVNGFIDDDRDLLAVTGNVREYHSWQWDDGNSNLASPAYPDNRFAWNPSAVRGAGWGWNFDDYYAGMAAKGVDVEPVFQGSPGWMFAGALDHSAGDSLKPFPLGRDSSLPASYLEHADYLYQFAARFGSANVAASKLRVDAANTPKSGLGSVKWMENWNEPDKDWKGRTGHFSPAVLAAMSSADYDGDQGRMGSLVGVKNADPAMKMALAGLIGIKTEYVKAMKFWAEVNREGSFPADALNFHHYCTDGGGQGSGVATTGISPEADGLLGRMREVAAWRDRYLPGKELWLSEFGWDTHSGSVFRARAIGGNDEFEMQARWLVRAFMAIAASGFDKGHIYMLRDDWDASPGTFATSGLVHDKDTSFSPRYEKKVSWYYVNTLHKTLRNYRFDVDESVGETMEYRFVHATDPDSIAYVVWSRNDSAAAKVVSVRSPMASPKLVRFAKGQAMGLVSSVPVVDGTVSVPDVDGRPVILLGKRDVSSIGNRASRSDVPVLDPRSIDGRRIRRDKNRQGLPSPVTVYSK